MQASEPSPNSPISFRGLVRIYAYYRFFLASMLLGMYLSRVEPTIFGTSSPQLYLAIAFCWVAMTAASLIWLIVAKFHSRQSLLLINLLLDLTALNLLMFCSGGLSSGIGFLLLITIAAGALQIAAYLVLFLAAFASILTVTGTFISI